MKNEATDGSGRFTVQFCGKAYQMKGPGLEDGAVLERLGEGSARLNIPPMPWPRERLANTARLAADLARDLREKFSVHINMALERLTEHEKNSGASDLLLERSRLAFALEMEMYRRGKASRAIQDVLADTFDPSSAIKIAAGWNGKWVTVGRWERLGFWFFAWHKWERLQGLTSGEALLFQSCFLRAVVDVGDCANVHAWRSAPEPELTELGSISWWFCSECPARVLFDPETEDGFELEPIVVYPPSCFSSSTSCACPRTIQDEPIHLDGCIAHLVEGEISSPLRSEVGDADASR